MFKYFLPILVLATIGGGGELKACSFHEIFFIIFFFLRGAQKSNRS